MRTNALSSPGLWLGVVSLVALASLACTEAPGKVGRGSSALDGDASSRLLAWGEGEGKVGYSPAIPEQAAMGAPAVAISPRGGVLVLDARNARVLKVEESGRTTELGRVDRDADDIAVGPDGAFAVKRTTTPRVVVYDPAGRRLGELDTRILQDVERIELGPSRRVHALSPHQESYLLGSPSLPLSAAEVLHSKREGVAFTARGEGLEVLRSEGGDIELVTVSRGQGEESRAEIVRRHVVARGTSARIVGNDGSVTCLRVETVTGTAEVSVAREAVCADAITGAVVFRAALASPGPYVPHRELTYGSGRLVFAHPEEGGLRLTTWNVAGGSR